MNRLDAEEKEILEAFESGKLKPVKNRSRELTRHRKVAEATFTKDSRINIRISSKDLRALQKRAPDRGLAISDAGIAAFRHNLLQGQMVEQPAGKGPPRPR